MVQHLPEPEEDDPAECGVVLARMTPTRLIFPVEEAASILLARRLGMGRGSSGSAEWPVKDVSNPGPKSGAAAVFLRKRRG